VSRPDAFVANVATEVPVSRSVDQIRALVERFRAREFRTIYGPTGSPVAVRFTITDPHLPKDGDHDGVFTVELAAPTDVLYRMIHGKRRNFSGQFVARDRAQAERVAWRQLHDMIRASLIAVQSGIVTLGEAFFANLIVTDGAGREARMAEVLLTSRLLTAGNGRLMLTSGGAS
jgi:hypothetical protein